MLALIGMVAHVQAAGFYVDVHAGAGWPHFQDLTQNIAMNIGTVNQYTSFTPPSQDKFLIGGGGGYQWDHRNIALSLGFNVQDLAKNYLAGRNSPFINGGSFDTLDYSAQETSFAVLFEPKLIWVTHRVQPYLLAGLGVSYNHAENYQETLTNPDSTAVPTNTPFNNATSTNFAYELGVGFQCVFSPRKYVPILAVDYRFTDWGSLSLAPYTNQPTPGILNLGHMRTDSVNVSLIIPFESKSDFSLDQSS